MEKFVYKISIPLEKHPKLKVSGKNLTLIDSPGFDKNNSYFWFQ